MERNPCRMEVELANMHFYFPQVATLLAIKNNKQPTERREKGKAECLLFWEVHQGMLLCQGNKQRHPGKGRFIASKVPQRYRIKLLKHLSLSLHCYWGSDKDSEHTRWDGGNLMLCGVSGLIRIRDSSWKEQSFYENIALL